METWKQVIGYKDYAVSDLGRVMRLTAGGNNFTKACRILKPISRPNGYLAVNLFKDGKANFMSIHKLVCTAFHGAKPTGLHEVAHNDGIKTNNFASNLRWATRKENHADKFLHGTHQRGPQNGNAKLSVEAIRQIRANVGTQKAAALNFGVSQGTISRIRNNPPEFYEGLL